MAEVFYFPRYSQRENFVTNNTLLLMYRLYDANRRRFQRFLAELLQEEADQPIAEIGLSITQQSNTSASVLDGYLHQSPIRIGIETKLSGESFNVDQLKRHLNAFQPGGSGYLIMLSPQVVDLTQPQWRDLVDDARNPNSPSDLAQLLRTRTWQ